MNRNTDHEKWVKCLLAVLLTGAVACRSKSPERKMVEYVNDPDNKIKQEITIGNTKATIRLMPDEYQQYLDSTRTDTAGSGYYYFNVRFDREGGVKPEKEKIAYLNFDMQQDFVMKPANGDSVKPAICQKIENGKGGSYEYMVAFEKTGSREVEDFTVFYTDKIFGTGTIAFVYSQKDIKKIPLLKSK